ncbi:hypothetical protein CPB97_001683 [Podila verticillata]|nr:hypothetical protein CPB97_001683 [Podila verticillata]
MFHNRHANLWRLRLLLIPFSLVVGALFAIARALDVQTDYWRWEPRDVTAIVISFISLATYIYAVWGAIRISTKIRTFLVFGLAYGLIFCCLSSLIVIREYGDTIVGCDPGDDLCQILRTAQVLGTITGFLMLLEAIMTGRLGPLDHSLRKHQYQSGGEYQTGAK